MVILFLPLNVFAQGQANNPDPHRFDEEIQNFTSWDTKNSSPKNAILFVGSSSIVLWPSAASFPDLPVINRGFGGSHISDVVYFYDRVVKPYNPSKIVFYAGDNDVAGEKTPEQVYDDFFGFLNMVQKDFPQTTVYYIPIKPSVARWDLWPFMDTANKMIEELAQKSVKLYYVDIVTSMLDKGGKPASDLFLDDGLHLNEKAYKIWNATLKPFLYD